jgi:deoxycytidine triphosphate deaminase/guanylate kinase
MIKIVVLSGVSGSGQTTTSYEIEKLRYIKRLKPFTTRPPRHATEDEYYFLDCKPDAGEVLWSIERAGYQYGMQRKEIERLEQNDVAVTVFDPMRLNELDTLRNIIPDLEIITIGLDTIRTEDEQARRTNGDTTRLASQSSIDRIRHILNTTDIRVSGDSDTVTKAVKAVCEIIMSRGGVLTKEQFLPLIQASALLKGATEENVQSASYDLRVGNEIWCNGQFIDLTDTQPIFYISPYSYAIIKAEETAAIPPFITAQFDIRVSHFLSGLILSNGPQVDPGYKGDLFCMIFNGNSTKRPIRKGDHFSSIQFLTTTRGGVPYAGYYRMRSKLNQHIPLEAASSPGGIIMESIDKAIETAKREILKEIPSDRSNLYMGIFGIFAAVLMGMIAFSYTAMTDVNKATAEVQRLMYELKNEKPMLGRELAPSRDKAAPQNSLSK